MGMFSSAHINIGSGWEQVQKSVVSDPELACIYQSQVPLVRRLIDAQIVRESLTEIALLDLGGADGRLVEAVRGEGWDIPTRVTCVDDNPEILDRNGVADECFRRRIEVPIADRQWDVVLIRYVMQYNSLEKQEAIVQSAYEMLKPGGICIHWWAGCESIPHQSFFQSAFRDGMVNPKLVREDSHWPLLAESIGQFKRAGFEVAIHELFTAPVRDVFRLRYGLSDHENSLLLSSLGGYAFLQYAVFTGEKPRVG